MVFALACGWVLMGAAFSVSAQADPATGPADDSYFAQSWTAEDGLPENRVVGIAQTADGYLWVLTRGGLVRFDGVRFQPFEAASSTGFTTSTMWNMYRDRQNNLWVAKEHGALVRIAETNLLALTAKDGLPEFGGQCSMGEDDEGGLWIAYNLGRVMRYKNGRVEDLTGKMGLPDGRECVFAVDRDGRLWFAKGGKVGIWRDGKFVTLKSFTARNIQIAPAHSGGIWACVGQKILGLSMDSEPTVLAALPDIRATAEPTALLEDRDGAVWLGTPAGLFRCDSNGVSNIQTPSPIISCLAEDREGGLWVGTVGGGLNRLRPRMVSIAGTAAGLPFEAVRSACQDTPGAIWAIGENSVLARGLNGTWSPVPFDVAVPNTHSTSVIADSNGVVWLGTDQGKLYRWNGGRFEEFNFDNAAHKGAVRSLFVTKAGDLWLATDTVNSSNFLYRIRGDGVKTFPLPTGYRIIRAMAEDAAGNFWAGASDGLLIRVSGDRLTHESTGRQAYSIRSLLATDDGSLWIGYAGFGVGRWRDGKFNRFGTEQGLPNNFVSQILADRDNRLWFAGNRGIFSVPEKDFDDVTAGRESQLQPVLFGRSQGLPNLQASFDFFPDAFRAADGRLYFSMLTGLAEFRTDRVRFNPLPPAVIIERVVADDRTFAEYQAMYSQNTNLPVLELAAPGRNQVVTLPPGLQHIDIEFTALSFLAPENVRFRYQLAGIDQNWVDAGTRRVATYTHLPPGNFHFKVIACNNDGIWNDTGAGVDITLEPHIWEMFWFKPLVVAMVVVVMSGSVFLILRRRHQLQIRQFEQQRSLERERARIARDLHDELGVGLTEIGLLGDLASTPDSSASQEAGRGYLHEITGRARELVLLLDEIVWAINPANDTSQSLNDYFLRFAQTLLHRASIRCRLEVAEPFPNYGLSSEKRHQLFLAFKESLNNVIRHSGASEVRISIGFTARELVISVEDNGRGLETGAKPGDGLGLIGMQERLQQLGGKCEVTAGTAGGTCVKLFIPVEMSKNI